MTRVPRDTGREDGIGPAADPVVRIAAYTFERVFGGAPAAVRHVPARLPLLDGLAVPLPWGAVAAAGRTGDGSVTLFSMNHYRTATLTEAPPWAREPVAVLEAYSDPVPGTRLLVRREIPEKLGLLTGAETAEATARVLRALHGPPAEPGAPRPLCAAPRPAHALLTAPGGSEHLPWNLAAHGLRLLIAALAMPPVPLPGAIAPEHAAATLRAARPPGLGPLLTEAHPHGDRVPDLVVKTALAAGALGARSLGACVVALAPASAIPRIRAEVTAGLARHLPRPPRYLTAS
ncbi:hypothetical protein AGRA3207_001485 [Actinomadura graeca]|uniref:Uncharacterized protein n=1 Tax=Actinomadura graeca TaxID=2750812 RepID=A0ABX8QSJ3_9ACTN|nr:hypothetical protein [Actinomadura graeca]QXJ20722.1 hypothetical protein AGRA3207_001485 [Actinomadura graeca]